MGMSQRLSRGIMQWNRRVSHQITEAVIFIPFSSHVISCVTGAAVHGQGWSLGPKRRPVRKETESCVGILRVRTKSGFIGLGNWGQSTRKGIIGVYYLIDTNRDPPD